jgi:sec-independent protein translocase protein TatA
VGGPGWVGMLADVGGIGAPELLIVLLIVVLLFGGAKLPKLAKSLGEAQREFRKGTADAAVRHPDDEASGTDSTSPTA